MRTVTKLLKRCEKAGLKLIPRLNNQLQIKGKISPELLDELTEHKAQILTVLYERWRIFCPYDGNPRAVRFEVCQWHRDEKDPKCALCSNIEKRMFYSGEEQDG